MVTANPYMLYCQDVHTRFGKKVVLNDIDLRVSPGELVTVVGPSGCGKSTLLRLILGWVGWDQFVSGTILVDGMQRTTPDRDVGIVFQEHSILENKTVLENIAFGPMLEKTTIPQRLLSSFMKIRESQYFPSWKPEAQRVKEEYLQKAQDFLARMGLADKGDLYPHELSGGMEQRVAIAQAMIMEPKVLLMDEPFSALDFLMREQLQNFVIELWLKEKMTIFFVTHSVEEAIYLGTRVIVLSPYYRTDGGVGLGSKIVVDLPIPGDHPRDKSFKTSQTLIEIKNTITSLAFEERDDRKLYIGDFLLKHPNSDRTVDFSEWAKEKRPNGGR